MRNVQITRQNNSSYIITAVSQQHQRTCKEKQTHWKAMKTQYLTSMLYLSVSSIVNAIRPALVSTAATDSSKKIVCLFIN
jgi:hypothetical protein